MAGAPSNAIISQVPFFHGNLSRHLTEVLLMENGEEGSFLVRDSTEFGKKFCVSVRGKDEVKHFPLVFDNDVYYFGRSEFISLESLMRHFANQPVLRCRSANMGPHYIRGPEMTLKYPYPAIMEEPETYDEIRFQSTELVEETVDTLNSRMKGIPLATKAGYLFKEGGFVKNWKYRWFVCIKNKLSYFEEINSETPINVIDLKKCSKCTEIKIKGKNHCFALEAEGRNWNFSAECEEDMEEWVALLKWKIKYNKSQDFAYSPQNKTSIKK
ncbi:dual adapter for phosphotyrosine and 3-phosphotyrosine and 3-phosphoinositide-like [Styela clava]